ncbi:MAG: hypothetical protein WCX77_00360 [Candidatus Paceibacterota bacterium]|jgi:hypothetical protein
MDQRISEYISQAKAGGMTGNQIKNELIKAGWPVLEVEEVLAASNSILEKNESSNSWQNFVIVAFILSMLGAAAYGFWFLDQKIKNEGPKVPFENQTTTDSQESSSSSSQDNSLRETAEPVSTKLTAMPADYQLEGAYFSSDGKNVLGVAKKIGQKFIFLNGELKSGGYDIVDSCQFSSAGSHFFCVAAKNKKKIVISDANEGNQYDVLIEQPVFSPDGEKLAYTAGIGLNKFFILNGRETLFPYDSAGKLVFSSDGFYLAYIAAKGADNFLVVNGKETKIEGKIYSDPVFSDDNEKIGYGVELNNELYWKEVEIN